MPNKKKKIGQAYLDRIAQRNTEDTRRRQRAFDNLLIYGTSTPTRFGGGSSSGGGASGEWDSTFDKYGPDRIVYTPVTREVSFGEKFADARRRGLDTFDFNGRPIAVKMSDNPKYTKAEYEVENLGTLRQVKDSQGKLYNDSTMFYPAPAVYGEFDRDKNPNVYDLGGPFNRFWQPPTSLNLNTDLMTGFDGLQPSQNLGLNFNPGQVSTPKFGGKLNSALGIAGGIASGLVDLYKGINADTSGIENAVDQQVDALGNIKYTNATSMDDLMNKQSSYRGLKANHKASEFYQGPSTGGIFANALSKGASAAMSASSTSPIGMAIAGGLSFASSLAGGLIGRNKQQKVADSETARLNAEERRKNAFMEASYRTDADNLVTKNNRNLMSQIAAYGGPLGISLNPVHGAIDFMQNEELLDSLEEGATKTNRKTSLPEFAFGGALGGYGGDWSNGLTYIGAGGSHEENPLGGVPAGMSQDGRPNQVEEGEYIWTDQDYVFSKRIEIPEEEYEALGLKKGKRKLTYADGAEILQKESAERPNDPISERGKNAALIKLMQSQEQQRALLAQQEQQEQIEYAMGGGLSRDKDYGSKKKPYPKVKDKDFAGGGRSYPIPTKADAIDALRLAGLHGRSDVKAKVYKKYPELKKALGGHLFYPGGPKIPIPKNYYQNLVTLNPNKEISYDAFNQAVDDWYKVSGFNDAADDSEVNALLGFPSYLKQKLNLYTADFPIYADEHFGSPAAKAYDTSDFQYNMWHDMPLFNDNSAIPFNKVVNNTGTSLLSSMYDANNNEYIAPEYKNKTKVPWNYLDRTTTGLYKYPDFDITLAPLFEYQYPLSSPRAKMMQNLGRTGNTNVAQNYWVDQNLQSENTKINLETNPNPVTVKDVNKYNRDLLPTSGWQTSLRYLPAIAPAISLGYQLLHKPDYGYADELDAAGNAYAEMIGNNGKVSPKFIGDYLAYNPFDRIFYANELGAQQAANRSAIMNAGNANRGATIAALLGSGYNDNVGLGKLFREGEEYNLAQRQKVADFNRGTNQYNSTLDMQAQEINAKANMAKAEALLNNKYRVLGMKQAIDSQRDQNISLALTNLFNNIGGIGEDFVNRYDRNALINADVFGTLSQKPYGVSDADWQDYVNAHKKVFSANGGKLNRKKKKGLTI